MLRRLAQSTHGLAMTEFAIVLPVLLLLYLGGYMISDMIACNRKVTIATRALTDLVTRNISPTLITPTTSASNYMSASGIVMTPYPMANATEQIALLRVCDAGHAYVVWMQAQTQTVDASGSIIASPITWDSTNNQWRGVVAPPNPSLKPGTLLGSTINPPPSQSAANIVSLPSGMVPNNSPLIPTSADGHDVCKNLSDPSTNGYTGANGTQVGTAGGYFFVGYVSYTYKPIFTYLNFGPTPLSDVVYMSPRLN